MKTGSFLLATLFSLVGFWVVWDYGTAWNVSAKAPEAIMVFSTTTPTVNPNRPYYSLWDGTSWGTVAPASLTAPDIRHVVVKCARFKEECLAITLDSAGYIASQVWDGSTWSATTTIAATTASLSNFRSFDLEYENGSDRAIVAYRTVSGVAVDTKVWDGSTWTTGASLSVPTGGTNARYVELSRQPYSTSTKIAMIVRGTSGVTTLGTVWGGVWDAGTWSNLGDTKSWSNAIGVSLTDTKEVDVAYMSESGSAMFVWGTGEASADINYRIWNGSSFTASTTFDISTMGNIGNWVRLSANPYSATNTIMLGVQDAAADLNTALWTGSAWQVHAEHDASVERITDMVFDLAFINATTSGYAWLAYGDGATVSRKRWQASAWSSASTAGDDTALAVLDSTYQNEGVLLGVYESDTSASDDITSASIIDSSVTWSGNTTLFGGLVNALAYFRIDIEPSRFYTYPTFTQNAYRFFENANSTDVGTALGSAQDIPATTPSPASPFRLRPLLHDATATSTAPEHEVVLQFATRSGTCDTAFSGESYATVTPATNIAFYDNASVVDAAAMTANGSDPSHSGHTRKYQGYEEANGATTTTDTAPGLDALWDFALYDNDGETATNSYCFRLVQRTGQLLATYSVIPEIATYVKPTISAAYNMVFDYAGSASGTAQLTVTDVGGNIISDGNNLRIAIATSSVNMLWDTTDTQAVFGGTASSTEVTSSVVSYEGGGSVMVVPVVDDFDAGDTLTISGLSFTSFNTATSSTDGAIGILTDGGTDVSMNATTTATVAIRGTLVLADHASSQVSDQWDTTTPTTTTHFRYKLTAAGEEVYMASTTFALSSVSGVAAADITSAQLFVDLNANGIKDSADAIATSTVGTILRPNANGTFSAWSSIGDCGTSWQCVDEDPPDEEGTYRVVDQSTSEVALTDSSNLPNPTGRSEVIANVRVVTRVRYTASGPPTFRQAVVMGGTLYKTGATTTPTTSYVNYSADWTTDPSDGLPWTWSDINSLEAGIFGVFPGTASPVDTLRLTQMWVEVWYELPNGTTAISGSSGSINFATSSSYRINGAKSYLLYLTASSLTGGDTMTVGLTAGSVGTSTGTTSLERITASGSATSIAHTADGAGATAPAVSSVTFNGGSAIDLIENTYKWASTSLLITDAEFCTTITSVTAKTYLASTTNSGTNCSVSDLTCYSPPVACVATTTGNTCGASDTTVQYDCGFKLWYMARPTDTGDWASSIWSVSATATDDGALTGTATNTGQNVDINSLSALDISPTTVSYGTLAPGANSGSTNATTTVTNTGNANIDPRLSGTAMSSADDSILVGQQEYSADPFIWGVGTALTSSATLLDITLPVPTATTTAITDTISWGLGVPSGKRSGSYTGTNTIEI